MKALMAICDGLGGRPTDFEGKTCLEAAETPNIDELAEIGTTGLLDPIKPGVRPGSDTSHLSLFGYDPYQYYTGRGIFEAMGIGMSVSENDVSFRTNFATVDENMILKDRRAGRITEGQDQLEKALKQIELSDYSVEVDFKASTEHRGALVLRGEGLSGNISDADPHETGVKVSGSEPLDDESSSKRTSEIVNELIEQSYEILSELPLNKRREEEGKLQANMILPRGAAVCPDIPSLEKRYGIKGLMTGAGALYIGVARALGMDFKKAKGVTGGADSPIINKGKLAVRELEKGRDFVFIHMKGADSCAHDHDAKSKISYIEKVDGVIGYLLNNLDMEDTHIAFTGDHTTPIQYGDHTSDPVPLAFSGPNIVPDEVRGFDERKVQKGGVGRISGNVTPILFGYCNWLDKFGA
ncbi:MAG: 2,3-bisphosphoglycerate-independent phosphoglycerate mutase [Candidatus Hadarchaeota archaeon]